MIYIPTVPDDYRPPRHCMRCYKQIIFTNVEGGQMWLHLDMSDHDVLMRKEGWWDDKTGKTIFGNGLNEILTAKRTEPTGLAGAFDYDTYIRPTR